MTANEYEGELEPRVDWVSPTEDATGDEEQDLESADIPLGVFDRDVTAAGQRQRETVAERARREEPEHDPTEPDPGELVIENEESEEDPSEARARFGSALGLSPEDRAIHEEQEP